jgi:crotonobetainyl-CoA:carnitine CoA-transferase CaiB-like acyl-CoA transferase
MPRGELNAGRSLSAYRTVAEALRDPQIAHRGALAEVEDGGGTFKVLNLPFRMSGANVSAAKADGDAGRAHACLPQETGLSEDEIAASPASWRRAR